MKGYTADELRPPGHEQLSIELTTQCNSSCLHCFARSGVSRRSSLAVDLVKGIMVEGYEAGYRHLHLTGGEPLLWKGLFEAMEYGFGLGYETTLLNTNGTLVTEEVSKRCADYGSFFSMSISLEGPEALHDRIRGKGSHRRAMLGIEKALKEGNHLTIFTTATRSLLPQLAYFVDDVYKEFPTIDYLILIQLIRPANGPFALREELLEPEDFIQLVRMVGLLHLGGRRTVVKKNPLANIVSQLVGVPWIPHVPPLYTKGSMMVMADRQMGVVHSNRNTLGKYRPGMIRKVLASNGYRRAVAPDQATCPSCRYADLCAKHGMVRPSQGYEHLCVDTPFCRRVLDRFASDLVVLGGKPSRRVQSGGGPGKPCRHRSRVRGSRSKQTEFKGGKHGTRKKKEGLFRVYPGRA